MDERGDNASRVVHAGDVGRLTCWRQAGLELVQHAVDTYKVLDLSDKGSFLKLVHSNSFWKDGVLTVEYRQPFDFIAKTNAEYSQKMAVSREKNDHCLIWLPFADSNHGQGD